MSSQSSNHDKFNPVERLSSRVRQPVVLKPNVFARDVDDIRKPLARIRTKDNRSSEQDGGFQAPPVAHGVAVKSDLVEEATHPAKPAQARRRKRAIEGRRRVS